MHTFLSLFSSLDSRAPNKKKHVGVEKTKQNKNRIHIAWQPYILNEYFNGIPGDVHPEVAKLVRRLCVVGGVGLTARLAVPGNPVAALGSFLNRNAVDVDSSPSSSSSFARYGPNHPGFSFPEIPPAAAAGGAHCGYEALCGSKLCAFSGPKHLAWSVPLLPSTYFLPSGHVHFLLFFLPAIFAPGSKIVIRRILAIGAIVIGPLLSMLMSATDVVGLNGGGKGARGGEEGELGSSDGGNTTSTSFSELLGFAAGNAYAQTWPAWWCFMSAGQALLVLAGDLFCRKKGSASEKARAARAAAEWEAAAVLAAAAAAASSAQQQHPHQKKRPQRKVDMNAVASTSVEQEYEVALSPSPSGAVKKSGGGRGGGARRRGAK